MSLLLISLGTLFSALIADTGEYYIHTRGHEKSPVNAVFVGHLAKLLPIDRIAWLLEVSPGDITDAINAYEPPAMQAKYVRKKFYALYDAFTADTLPDPSWSLFDKHVWDQWVYDHTPKMSAFVEEIRRRRRDDWRAYQEEVESKPWLTRMRWHDWRDKWARIPPPSRDRPLAPDWPWRPGWPEHGPPVIVPIHAAPPESSPLLSVHRFPSMSLTEEESELEMQMMRHRGEPVWRWA